MYEMSVEKWWNDICGRGKREKPHEKPTQNPLFVHHETHMEWPRRELGTPAVGGERLTACVTGLFSITVFNFFLALFPFAFTRTTHIAITLLLALPLWLTFIIFGWINKTHHIFPRLDPQELLILFIVCIETISNIIRPGTLAVRLAANIIAGLLKIKRK